MFVSIEPELLERAVFRAVRSDPALNDEYQRAFSGGYREPVGDRREQAFATLHELWFDRLGLRRRVLDSLRPFPLISGAVTRLLVAEARSRGRSSVELFGKPGGYAILLTVTPAQLLDAAAFEEWARFELMHVEDMLDPAFGYDKNALSPESNLPTENRMRERFALLWALTIHARCNTRMDPSSGLRERRRVELMRAFSAADPREVDTLLDRLWPLDAVAIRPTQAALLDLARQGLPGNVKRRDDSSTHAGGSACPLCRFPTFDWADVAAFDESLRVTVMADFPHWRPADGLCGRCAELYRSRSNNRTDAAMVSL